MPPIERLRSLKEQTDGGILVVGSCFMDYIAYAARSPGPGETLHSDGFQRGFGGKGANQAVMAAKLGSRVVMLSALGTDGDGDAYEAELKRNGIDTSMIKRIPGEATGLAMITVSTTSGQNQIIICPNATRKFGAGSARSSIEASLQGIKVLVCQHEVPLPTTLLALELAAKRGVYTIFNSAPAPSKAEAEIIKPYLKYVSLFCPNETEAALLTDVNVVDADSAALAAKRLHNRGVRDVVITLGKNGYFLSAQAAPPRHYPAAKTPGPVIDTTGAGDCFVGALAHYLARGQSLERAAAAANICASISVTRRGTQSSYPSLNELPDKLRM